MPTHNARQILDVMKTKKPESAKISKNFVPTSYPSGINPADMLQRGYFIVNFPVSNGSTPTNFFQNPRYVYPDRLYYKSNGKTYRAVFLMVPIMFSSPNDDSPVLAEGYVYGYAIDNGLVEIMPLDSASFLEKTPAKK
jgi:hypothetical protein